MYTTHAAQYIGLSAQTIAVYTRAAGDDIEIRGLDDRRARELRARVRSALNIMGLPHGFAVSFDRVPERTAYVDLAVMAGCLLASGRYNLDAFRDALYLGALDFNGNVLPVRGVLPMLRGIEGFSRAFVPWDNGPEAGLNDRGTICERIRKVSDLIDPSSYTREFVQATRSEKTRPSLDRSSGYVPPQWIIALRAALSTGQMILLTGAHVDRAARVAWEMLPDMSSRERLDVACVHSVAGVSTAWRPWRAPHPSINDRGIYGGGDPIYPGEVSLAHAGVLYLGDVLNFRSGALELAGIAVRAGEVTIRRGERVAVYPAACRIVASVRSGDLGRLTPERLARLEGLLGPIVRVDLDSC